MEALSQQVTDHLIQNQKGKEKNNEVQALCPFHSEKNPSFSYNTQKYIYNCLSCSAEGYLTELAKHLGFSTNGAETYKKKKHEPPKKQIETHYQNLLKNGILYWTKRGITKQSVEEGKIGLLQGYKNLDWDVFPYFDTEGNFFRYKAVSRTKINGKKPAWWSSKGKGLILYGVWFLTSYTTEKPLILCEGEKDFWILKQEGYQVLGVSGAQAFPKKYIPLIKDYNKYILFDNDQGGFDGSLNVLKKLKEGKICDWKNLGDYDPEGFDVNDLYLNDCENFNTYIETLIKTAKNPFISDTEKALEKSTIEENQNQLDIIRMNSALTLLQTKKTISKYIIEQLTLTGKWYYTKSFDFYYFSTDTKELFNLYSIQFILFLHKLFGINEAGQEFDFIMNELKGYTYQQGIRIEIRMFCHYRENDNILYIFDNLHSIYKISPKYIKKVDNGTDGILFLKDLSFEPFKVDTSKLPVEDNKRKNLNIIFDNPNYAKDSILKPDEARMVFSYWFFFGFFLEHYPVPPLLAFVGPKNSSKTMTLKMVRALFYGMNQRNVYTLGESKKEAEMYVLNRFHWFFDNQDEKIKGRKGWIMDFLATLITGIEITGKTLYKNKEMWAATPRGIPALTSHTLDIRRNDVVNRMLIIDVETREKVIPESQIFKNLMENRNKIMASVMSELQEAIQSFEKSYTGNISFRLADFAHFCLTWSQFDGQLELMQNIIEKLSGKQHEFTLEEDPVYQALEVWVGNDMNTSAEITTKGLYKDLKIIADQEDIEYFPKSSIALGKKMTNLKTDLRHYYHITSKRGTKNETFWIIKAK